jgi:EAL domain-containing protein (putative c-di-GMP-specific phosphodiesterase class I)
MTTINWWKIRSSIGTPFRPHTMTDRKQPNGTDGQKPSQEGSKRLPPSAQVLPFRPRKRPAALVLDSGNALGTNQDESDLGQLWHAITEERIVTHYQPQFRMNDGRTFGMEALVRIRRRDGTLLYPDSFIRVAEESGMIIPLGRRVIHQACHDLASWRANGLKVERISINLSAHQINTDDRFIEYVQQVVLTHGLDYSDLEFELTERQALNPMGVGTRTLCQLSALGARLAIDDFGTGYSSLAYLSNLPVDTVKIDRCMVSRLDDCETTEWIIRHLLNMARDLNLAVIGEGVETATQQAFLARNGCDYGQGFLVSRPLSAEQVTRFLTGSEQTQVR